MFDTNIKFGLLFVFSSRIELKLCCRKAVSFEDMYPFGFAAFEMLVFVSELPR